LACKVASASLEVLLASDWQNKVKKIEQQLVAELTDYQSNDLVKEVRVKGAIGVIELYDLIWDQMTWLPKFIVDQGVWIRPFKNLIYIMPPYIIKAGELSQLTAAIGKVLLELNTRAK